MSEVHRAVGFDDGEGERGSHTRQSGLLVGVVEHRQVGGLDSDGGGAADSYSCVDGGAAGDLATGMAAHTIGHGNQ
jgi:hypothetical protein